MPCVYGVLCIVYCVLCVDHLQEQADELEVLQSIYPEEFGPFSDGGDDVSPAITHRIQLMPDEAGGENYGSF
jgi:hypothetical protein